jgi:hypothetical protein
MMYKRWATRAKLLQRSQRKKVIIIIDIGADNYFHMRIVLYKITKIIFSGYLLSCSGEQADFFDKI